MKKIKVRLFFKNQDKKKKTLKEKKNCSVNYHHENL